MTQKRDRPDGLQPYRWELRDEVFFNRCAELSDRQTRLYLNLRRGLRKALADTEFRREVERASEGKVLGIELADLIMDIELLCDKGIVLRTPLARSYRT